MNRVWSKSLSPYFLITVSKVNRDHEIGTQKWWKNNFAPHWDLNHIPMETKASMQPKSYADPFSVGLGLTYNLSLI